MIPFAQLKGGPTKLLVVASVALSGYGMSACGEGGKKLARSSNSASRSATTATRTVVQVPLLDADRDDDNHTGSHYDGDEYPMIHFGHEAGVADGSAIRAMLKRYYAAAAVADGGRACSLIYPLEAESLAEQAEESGGSSGSRGVTCAVVASKVFKRRHRELAVKAARMRVVGVRVEGDLGTATIGFTGEPEGYVLLHRERGWKMASLTDAVIP